MSYDDDDDVDLDEFYYDAQDIAQGPTVYHQQPTNRAQTPRAEREITQLARFSSLFPEENFEVLRGILQDSDYKLERAINRLVERISNDDQQKSPKSNSASPQNQNEALAASGVVPKRHTPEAIEAKLVMILEMYPDAIDTRIRRRLEDSIDLDLEALEIVNELQPPDLEENEMTEPNLKEIQIDRNMEEYLSQEDKNNLLHITQIFPDVDPHFLFDQIAVQMRTLENIVDSMTHDSGYPKLKQRLEKERRERRRQEFLNSEQFDILSYLNLFEDPEIYFNDQTRNVAPLYARHALVHLMNLFRNMLEDFIQRQLEIHNNHFLPTFLTISNGSTEPRKPMNFGMAQYNYGELRPMIPWPDDIDEMFFRELQYLQHEDQIRALLEFMTERTRQREQREHEAEVKGQLIECQCCFNNNKLPEDMIACQQNNNHSFCRGCVRQHAEMQISQGFHRVNCMTGFCSAEYNVRILQNLLRSASMDILLRRRQQDELRNAQLDNMESCPFCDFAMVIENTNEKVFKCQNPDCLRESCRQCKEPNHIPLRCNEVEKDAEIRMRTYIENKMAEAWIRICPKCNKRLIKTTGCNALHCPCGAGICYVCNELLPVEGRGYGHFIGAEQIVGLLGRFTGQSTASKPKCPLSTPLDSVNADVAERAGKEARALYLRENPHVEQERQQIDDQRVEQLVDRQASGDGQRPAQHFRMLRPQMQFGEAQMLRRGPRRTFEQEAYNEAFNRERQRQREREVNPIGFIQRYHTARPPFEQQEQMMDQHRVARRRVEQINVQRDHIRVNLLEQYAIDIARTIQEIIKLESRDGEDVQTQRIELERKLERLQRYRMEALTNLELATREFHQANQEVNRTHQIDPQNQVQYNFGDVQVPPGAAVHIKNVGDVHYAVAVNDNKVKEQTSNNRGQKGQTVGQNIVQNARNIDAERQKVTIAESISERIAMIEEQEQLEQQMINEHDRLNQESHNLDEQIAALQRRKREVYDQMVFSERRLAQAREGHARELDRMNEELTRVNIGHNQRPTINVDQSKKEIDPQLAQSTVVLVEDDDNDSKSDQIPCSDRNKRVNTIIDLVKQSIPNAEREQVVCVLLKHRERMGGRMTNKSLSELVKAIVTELKPVCSVLPVQRKSVAKLLTETPQAPLNQSDDRNQHVVVEQETALSESRDQQIVSGHTDTPTEDANADDSTIRMRIRRDGQFNINIQLPQQETQQQVESQPNSWSESDKKEKGMIFEKKTIDADVDLIDFGPD